jgi:hypothetical protein
MPENISGVPAGRSIFHLTSPFIGPFPPTTYWAYLSQADTHLRLKQFLVFLLPAVEIVVLLVIVDAGRIAMIVFQHSC